MVKYTGRGLVVKRPGVLSKVQMLNLVLGVGVFSLLPRNPQESGRKESLSSNAVFNMAAMWIYTFGRSREVLAYELYKVTSLRRGAVFQTLLNMIPEADMYRKDLTLARNSGVTIPSPYAHAIFPVS